MEVWVVIYKKIEKKDINKGLRSSSIIICNILLLSNQLYLFLYFYLFIFQVDQINHLFLLSISIVLLIMLLLLNIIMIIGEVKIFIVSSTYHCFGGSCNHSCPFFTPDTDAKLILPTSMTSLTLTGIIFVKVIKEDLLLEKEENILIKFVS